MLANDWIRMKIEQRKGRRNNLRLFLGFSFGHIRKGDNTWVGGDGKRRDQAGVLVKGE